MANKTQLKKLDKTHRVSIANNFIDEASYNLTKVELQCFYSILSVIEPTDISAKKIKFDGHDLINHLDKSKDKNAFKVISQAFETLRTKEFYLVKFDKRNNKRIEREIKGSFLSSVDINYKEKSIEVEISEKMQLFVNSLKKRFLSFQIFEILSLKSKYSIRFYVTADRHLKANETERFIDKNELKEIYRIEEKYIAKFSDLKRRVLNPSQKEVSEKTSIAFDLAVVRSSNGRGGKIEGVLLKNIRENKIENQLITKLIENEVGENDASKLYARGFSQIRDIEQRELAKKRYDGSFEHFLEAQISYVASRKYDIFLKYLRTCIQKDYGYQEYHSSKSKKKKLLNLNLLDQEIETCKTEIHKLELVHKKESEKVCFALLKDNEELRAEIESSAQLYPINVSWTNDIMNSLDHPIARAFAFDKIQQKFPALFQTSKHADVKIKKESLSALESQKQQTITG